MSNPIHSTSAKSVLPMLAMRGLATGLCAGCVVGLLRLSHDRAAARVALWLEEWREVWWTVPIDPMRHLYSACPLLDTARWAFSSRWTRLRNMPAKLTRRVSSTPRLPWNVL